MRFVLGGFGAIPASAFSGVLGGVGGSNLDSEDLEAVADTYNNNPLPIILVY